LGWVYVGLWYLGVSGLYWVLCFWCVVSCWESSVFGCVVLVCGIVLGFLYFGLCDFGVVSWWGSSLLCCVVVGVWFCVGGLLYWVVCFGVCYRDGVYFYWVAWLLVCGIVVGFTCIG